MADDVMALEERLARLEMTVANGFSETGARIERLERVVSDVESGLRGEIGSLESGLRGEIGNLESELRGEIRSLESGLRGEIGTLGSGLRGEIGSLESRLRILIEAGRDEQRTMAEVFGFTLDRIDARLERMHQEHLQAQGDHGRVIHDHERRLTALERRRKDPRSDR